MAVLSDDAAGGVDEQLFSLFKFPLTSGLGVQIGCSVKE